MDKNIRRTEKIRKKRELNEPKEIICIREINENIKRVFNNQPLTRPLRTLNNNCEFKKRYELAWDLKNKERIEKEVKKKKREYNREYNQKPEVKKKKREYFREYYQKPEVKKKKREYYEQKKHKQSKSKEQ